MSFTFSLLTQKELSLVLSWLQSPHVSRWFHTEGLENTLKGMEKQLKGTPSLGTYWIAYLDQTPIGFLITSYVREGSDSLLLRWKTKKKALTLDLLIGEQEYLGKGLGVNMIEAFLELVFPDVQEVFIDPEVANTKAIHVFEKVGFKKVEKFIASWNPKPHLLMRLTKRF